LFATQPLSKAVENPNPAEVVAAELYPQLEATSTHPRNGVSST
jgi:hypothetical protein